MAYSIIFFNFDPGKEADLEKAANARILFCTDMTFEQQKNTKALSITVGVHVLLLLLFLLFKYNLPAQLPVEELGMEVNLGTSENGYGTEQPEMKGDPAPQAAIAVNRQAIRQVSPFKNVHTTDDEQAPAIAEHRAHTDKNRAHPNQSTRPNRNAAVQNRTASNEVIRKAAEKPKFLYPGSTGTGGNGADRDQAGGNEGIGTGNGDMGVPGGTPGASNYAGVPGSGNMSYSLNNRKLVSKPDPKAAYREGGTVKINVTVNREGDIIRYSVASATNAAIRAIAIQKLKKVRFNKAPNAKPEEFGSISFNFSNAGH
jgi:outer membrane biosynthesis protein TonB